MIKAKDNKGLTIIVILLLSYFTWVDVLKTPFRRKQIDKHLSENTALTTGILVEHGYVRQPNNSKATSTVKFEVEGHIFYAKMLRLQVKTGIHLDVKYNISDPHWNRVMLPDTLRKYRCSGAMIDSERYYTWPPQKDCANTIYEKNVGPF